MSKNELENQIFGIKNDLTKIEEGAERKELYIKNKIYKEYAPQFNEIESVLQVEQNKLDVTNRKIEELFSVKKELIARIKDIKRKDNDLNKEKTKKLNAELKAIGKEKHTKMNIVSKQIKVFEKELKTITH